MPRFVTQVGAGSDVAYNADSFELAAVRRFADLLATGFPDRSARIRVTRDAETQTWFLSLAAQREVAGPEEPTPAATPVVAETAASGEGGEQST